MRTVTLIAVPLILVVVGLYIAALPPDEGPPPRSDDPPERVDTPLVSDADEESKRGEGSGETPFVVTVRDPSTGKPVPGAKTVLMGKGFRKEGVTDSEGRVELQVPAGPVRIRVSGEGRATTQVDTVAAAGGTAKPFDLPLGATLAGRVVEKGTGHPIGDALVRGFTGRKEARTDTEGRFRFDGLGTSFGFQILADLHVSETVNLKGLEPGKVTEREFALAPAGRVSGQVVDHTGAPVEGAWVSVRWSSVVLAHRGRHPDPTHVVLTDESGRFTLPGVPPGEQVRVFAAFPRVASGASAETEVRVGGESPNVMIALQPPRSVTIRFVTEDGTLDPPSAVWPRAAPDDPWAPVTGPKTHPDFGRRAKNSMVELVALVPGRYVFRVNTEGYLPVELKSEDILPGPGEESREIEVTLERGKDIFGVVLDTQGKPVPDIEVVALRQWQSGSYARGTGTSGPDGGFRIEGVPPGKYLLIAKSENGADLARKDDVESGSGNTTLEIVLTGILSGRVLDPTGTPATSRTVLAFRDRGGELPGTGQDRILWARVRDGAYRLELPAGNWWLLAPSTRHTVPGVTRIEVGRGETEASDIRLLGQKFLSGRVSGPGGPLAGAIVVAAPFPIHPAIPWMYRTDVGAAFEVKTDSEGRYRMEGPGSGRWNVHAYHPEALPAHTEVTVDASRKETKLDLELSGGAWIAVTVDAPAGPLRFQAWVETGGPPRPRTLDTRYGDRIRSSGPSLEAEAPVQPGHGVRLGPLPAGTHRIKARALLPVPGTNEIVRLDREEKVVLPEEGRAAVTFRFTVEEIESARKR